MQIALFSFSHAFVFHSTGICLSFNIIQERLRSCKTHNSPVPTLRVKTIVVSILFLFSSFAFYIPLENIKFVASQPKPLKRSEWIFDKITNIAPSVVTLKKTQFHFFYITISRIFMRKKFLVKTNFYANISHKPGQSIEKSIKIKIYSEGVSTR
ncbi:CLUMA_CG021146, isoform A [Clunio marinus]|uniref:CLUMA_CG021146, isoform A n=1 Tax=Clunio marinus TaxID=568069 RepID=A0A1J1J6C3_9DIPT|nr:CLUMA_CG021146, isoform A [Clunio marinus]